MAVDKSLVSGSTTMLVLKLLEENNDDLSLKVDNLKKILSKKMKKYLN